MPTKRARTISITSDALKTTCARRIVFQPSAGNTDECSCACEKKISDATAITISGTTSVR